MPIEIKELHIRVAVNTPSGGPPPAGPKAASSAPGASESEAKEALVAECVEQVLNILRNRNER